jgi:hypothetical protein
MTLLTPTLLTAVVVAMASFQTIPALAQGMAASPATSSPSGPAASSASVQAPRAEPSRPAGAPPAMDPHRQQDVARHRAIATAHETAARCLEAGERESVCQDRLRKACEGIAIGRYCGMKHGH